MKKVEQIIQRDILNYLKLAPGYFWRNQATGLYDPVRKIFRKSAQMRGTADILGLLPNGRFVAIEVKAPGGRLSDYQKGFLHQVRKNGGLTIVAFSVANVHDQIKLALDGEI